MELLDAVYARHSVLTCTDRPIEGDTLQALPDCIDRCSSESSLHIQPVLEGPLSFDSTMAHYGKFSGAKNYVALIGKKSPWVQKLCGYYGKKSCCLPSSWVSTPAGYHVLQKGLLCLSGGAGRVPLLCHFHRLRHHAGASPHRQRPLRRHERAGVYRPRPVPLRRGCRSSAPTAADQQKFTFSRQGNRVTAKGGLGFYSKIAPGIVKYHFELAAGPHTFTGT